MGPVHSVRCCRRRADTLGLAASDHYCSYNHYCSYVLSLFPESLRHCQAASCCLLVSLLAPSHFPPFEHVACAKPNLTRPKPVLSARSHTHHRSFGCTATLLRHCTLNSMNLVLCLEVQISPYPAPVCFIKELLCESCKTSWGKGSSAGGWDAVSCCIAILGKTLYEPCWRWHGRDAKGQKQQV